MATVVKPATLLSNGVSVQKVSMWKNRLDHALRHLDDRSQLNSNPLSRLKYVKHLADTKYQGKTLPCGLALRQFIVDSINRITKDAGNDRALSRLSTYLVCISQGLNRRQASQKLGLSREYASREIRPRALELLTSVMLETIKHPTKGTNNPSPVH